MTNNWFLVTTRNEPKTTERITPEINYYLNKSETNAVFADIDASFRLKKRIVVLFPQLNHVQHFGETENFFVIFIFKFNSFLLNK